MRNIRKTILIIFIVISLLSIISTANQETLLEEEIILNGETKEFSLPNLSSWKKFSYEVDGDNSGNTEFWIYGENGKRRFDSFKAYVGNRPKMRFMGAQEGHKGYNDYPATDFQVSPNKYYTINVTRTGPWKGSVRVFESETGEEVFPVNGERVEDRYLFHVFEDRNGSFQPEKIVLRSNKQSETAKFRNIKVFYEEKEDKIEPAPENSLLLVEPEWRKVLIASTMETDIEITNKFEKEKENYSRVYSLGDVEKGGKNVTEISEDQLPRVFYPNKTGYIKANPEKKEEALKLAEKAMEEKLPLSFEKLDDREKIKPGKKEEKSRKIVLADTSQPCSALAPLHSNRTGGELLIANSEKETPEEIAQKLGKKYDNKSKKSEISQVLNGLTVTNFGAPGKKVEDPVESNNKVVFKDEIDGTSFRTDKVYTDLDSDGFIDVNYGRIPSNISQASKILEKTEKNEKALVAAEYRASTWPQVISQLGGGLTDGIKTGIELNNQGIPTEVLVENRTSVSEVGSGIRGIITTATGVQDPLGNSQKIKDLLEHLVNLELKKTVQKIYRNPDKIAKIVEKYRESKKDEEELVTEKDDVKVSKVLSGVKNVQDINSVVKAVLEYRFEPDIQQLKKLPGKLKEEKDYRTVEKTVLKSLLKHRPSIKENLGNLSKYSKIVYFGEGNSSHWILPNQASLIDGLDNYNGSNSYTPRDVEGLLVDTSPMTAVENSKIIRNTFSSESEGIVGFSANTFQNYASELVQRFIQLGYTNGAGYRKSYNRYKKDSWTYDPHNALFFNSYWRSRARKNKSLNSYRYYGKPGTVKDPVENVPDQPETECENGKCIHTWKHSTEYEKNDRFRLLRDVETHKEPGMPEVYFRKFTKTLPENTEIIKTDLKPVEKTSINTEYAENASEFPKNPFQKQIEKKPDGRKELILKVPVIRKKEEKTELLEKFEIQVETDQDTTSELERKNNKYSFRIDTNTSLKGKPVFRVMNRTWKQKTVGEKTKFNSSESFSIRPEERFDLEKGRYVLEAYFIGETVIGPERIEIDKTEELEIKVDKKAKTGDRIRLDVISSPKNNAKIITEKGLQTGFLEKNNLKTGESTILRPLKPGTLNGVVRADNHSETFSVETEKDGWFKRKITSIKEIFSSKNTLEKFKVETRKGKENIVLKSYKGFIRKTLEPGEEKTVLKTDEWKFYIEKTPKNITRKLETKNGFLEKTISSGEKKFRGNMELEDEFENRYNTVILEEDKLKKRKDIRRSGFRR